MAAFSGKNGKVTIGASDVIEVTKWNFNDSSNNPSWHGSGGGGFKKRVAGVKDGSGSIEGKQDDTDPIEDHLAGGTSVTLLLYENASRFWSVPAIIGELDVDDDVDEGEPVSWSVSFETNGVWTPPA